MAPSSLQDDSMDIDSPPGHESRLQSGVSDEIEQLQSVCRIPPKQRSTNVSALVQRIASAAFDTGLGPGDLDHLMDVLTQTNQMDQGSLTTVIKNLYPASKVPSTIIIKIVCALGPGRMKPAVATQVLLLQWILLVYEVLEDPYCLSRLYRTLFNHLDMLSLRRPLCHLLCVITRRRHVRPYRIQALLEHQQNVGDDPALRSLIKVYKDYYPQIVVAETKGKRWNYFAHQDHGWVEHLHRIHQAANDAALLRSSESLDPHSSFRVARSGAKRSRISVIPEVQTSGSNKKQGAIVLEDIENVAGFVNNLENIELPNQIISGVRDPLAMKLLKIKPDANTTARLENWLEGYFNDVSRGMPDQEDAATLENVLEQLQDYVRFMKAMPAALDRFLRSYLQTRGSKISKTELELLTFLPSQRFKDLHSEVLASLEAKVITSSPDSKAILLDFYASLLTHWVNMAISDQAQAGAEEPRVTRQNMSQLVDHASCLALAMVDDQHDALDQEALLFFHRLGHLVPNASSKPTISISLPPPYIFYKLAFKNDMGTVSQVCTVLTSYKVAFEESMAAAKDGSQSVAPHSLADVNRFNGYVMDICNLLWRNRALNQQDQNALGCMVPIILHSPMQQYLDDFDEKLLLPSLFSVSYHGALSAASAACFAELEATSQARSEERVVRRLKGPVSQRSLALLEKQGGLPFTWQNYRLEMLKWLDDRGCNGIGNLMRSTMKLLRKNGG